MLSGSGKVRQGKEGCTIIRLPLCSGSSMLAEISGDDVEHGSELPHSRDWGAGPFIPHCHHSLVEGSSLGINPLALWLSLHVG